MSCKGYWSWNEMSVSDLFSGCENSHICFCDDVLDDGARGACACAVS